MLEGFAFLANRIVSHVITITINMLKYNKKIVSYFKNLIRRLWLENRSFRLRLNVKDRISNKWISFTMFEIFYVKVIFQ